MLPALALWLFSSVFVYGKIKEASTGYLEKLANNYLADLDLHISYISAAPGILGRLSINSIRVENPDLLLEVDKLKLDYDLRTIFSGKFVIKTLRLEGVNGHTSLSAVQTLTERLTVFLNKQEPGNGYEQGDIAIMLRKFNLDFYLGNNISSKIKINTADMLSEKAGGLKLGTKGSIEVQDPSSQYGLSFISLPFALNATILAGNSSSFVADIQADSNYGQLLKSRLFFFTDKDKYTLEFEPVKGIRKLTATYIPSKNSVYLNCRLDSFIPSTKFKAAPALERFKNWLSTAYTGELSFVSEGSIENHELKLNLQTSVPLDFPGGKPLVYIKGYGKFNNFHVEKASLTNTALKLEYKGYFQTWPLAANGSLEANFLAAPQVNMAGKFEVNGSDKSWFMYSPVLDIAGSSIRDAFLSMDFSSSGAAMYFEAAMPEDTIAPLEGTLPPAKAISVSDTKEVYSEATSERLKVEAVFSLSDFKPVFFESNISLNNLRIAAFPNLVKGLLGANLYNVLSPLTIQGDLVFYSDFKSLSYNSSGLVLSYDGMLKGFGIASFSGGLQGLTINDFNASISGIPLSGSAYIEYKTKDITVLNSNFIIKDIPYSLNGILSGSFLTINGDYGLKLAASIGSNSVYLTLDIEDMPIALFGFNPFLSTKLVGNFNSIDSWNILLERLAIEQPPGNVKNLLSFETSGIIDNNGGTLTRLLAWDKISRLEGKGSFTWVLAKKPDFSIDMQLAGPEEEYYSLKASYDQSENISGNIKLKKCPLARIPVNWLKGKIDANIDFSGTVKNPSLDFIFALNEGHRAKGFPFISGKGSYTDKTISLNDTRVRLDDFSLSQIQAQYKLDEAALALSTDILLNFGTNSIKASLFVNGQSDTKNLMNDFFVQGSINGLEWGKDKYPSFPVDLNFTGEDIYINAGLNKQLQLDYNKTGELSLILAKSLPVALVAKGKIADSIVSMDLKDAVVDLPFLFKLIGLPIIRAESGKAYGEASIKGNLSDPNVEGSFNLSNFYLSVSDYIKEPIGPLDEPLFFTGRTMETVQTSAKCGNANVVVSLRSELIHALPLDLSIGVKTEGPGLAPVKMKILGLDIEGLAKPDLLIEVNENHSRLSGNIQLSSGDVVLTTGLASLRNDTMESSSFSGNLNLTFGKSVKAYFPNKKTFPVILYGQADPSSKLLVVFDTEKGNYSIKGTTRLRGGSVFYIQKNFYLKNALIEFDEDEYQFDPRISAEAELRTSTASGPVIITLRAEDSRFSNLSFRLESSPALSENQIQQLLGQGLTGSTEDGKIDISRILIENYDLIPELNLIPIFERNLQAVLGFDLLVLRSQIMPKLILGLSGLDGNSRSLSLGDYLAGTALVGGKYLGDKVFLQTRIGLESDPLAKTMGLRLDSEFSLEWKAPDFTLLWSIRPQNPDTLFLEDQSFSFLWRIPLK